MQGGNLEPGCPTYTTLCSYLGLCSVRDLTSTEDPQMLT